MSAPARLAEPDEGIGGEPVTRMAPRALLIPPGFPDFMSRARVVRPGALELEEGAWSGRAPVSRVELSTDGGRGWGEAGVEPAGAHRWAWRRWRFAWTAVPGDHVLMARATDAEGRTQPWASPGTGAGSPTTSSNGYPSCAWSPGAERKRAERRGPIAPRRRPARRRPA